jgi:hypothetical protein
MLTARFAQIRSAVEQKRIQARLTQTHTAALKGLIPGKPIVSREGALALGRQLAD